MIKTQKIKDIFIHLFDEGKYVDLWTVPHVLSGVLAMLGAYLISLNFWIAFAVSTTLMILWEVYEDYARRNEHLTNRISDVVTGVLGFLGVHFLIKFEIIKNIDRCFWVCLVIFGIMNLLGFLSYKTENRKKVF